MSHEQLHVFCYGWWSSSSGVLYGNVLFHTSHTSDLSLVWVCQWLCRLLGDMKFNSQTLYTCLIVSVLSWNTEYSSSLPYLVHFCRRSAHGTCTVVPTLHPSVLRWAPILCDRYVCGSWVHRPLVLCTSSLQILSNVNFLMCLQISCTGETLITNVTFKWLLSGVSQHMSLQVPFASECYPTIWHVAHTVPLVCTQQQNLKIFNI
jgi:hypothetical protein